MPSSTITRAPQAETRVRRLTQELTSLLGSLQRSGQMERDGADSWTVVTDQIVLAMRIYGPKAPAAYGMYGG